MMDGILITILIMILFFMAENFYLFSKSKKENLKIKEEYKNLIIVLRRLDLLLTVKAKKTGEPKNDDVLRQAQDDSIRQATQDDSIGHPHPSPSVDGFGPDDKNGRGNTKNIANPLRIKRGNYRN